MRRMDTPCHVSTYVRSVVSLDVSSTVGPPIELAHTMLNRDKSDVVPTASGVYMSNHTHRAELELGTNRSEGVKSTEVTPFVLRTSACTFSDVWSGEQG